MDAATAYIAAIIAFTGGFWLGGKRWLMARHKGDDDRLDRAVLQEIRALRCQVAVLHNEVEAIKAQLNQRIQLQGGGIMFVVKDDNPDVGYTITPPTVTDSEGNAVDAGALTFEVTSTDDAVVSVAPVDQLTGTVHFGNPGQASINVNVKNDAGTLLGAFGAQFTITVGDPSAIAGGSITFDGLTET